MGGAGVSHSDPGCRAGRRLLRAVLRWWLTGRPGPRALQRPVGKEGAPSVGGPEGAHVCVRVRAHTQGNVLHPDTDPGGETLPTGPGRGEQESSGGGGGGAGTHCEDAFSM